MNIPNSRPGARADAPIYTSPLNICANLTSLGYSKTNSLGGACSDQWIQIVLMNEDRLARARAVYTECKPRPREAGLGRDSLTDIEY